MSTGHPLHTQLDTALARKVELVHFYRVRMNESRRIKKKKKKKAGVKQTVQMQ
jgi:hypothetical protein